MVQNRRTSVQKIHTLVQQTAYRLVRTRVPDRPDHPKCLYTQQLAIFKPRLSYFRLLKAQLNRSCLNLICYILWYASNKKCTERFEPWYKKLYRCSTTQTTVHGTVHFVQVRVPLYRHLIYDIGLSKRANRRSRFEFVFASISKFAVVNLQLGVSRMLRMTLAGI